MFNSSVSLDVPVAVVSDESWCREELEIRYSTRDGDTCSAPECRFHIWASEREMFLLQLEETCILKLHFHLEYHNLKHSRA